MKLFLVEDNADDASLTQRAVKSSVPEADIVIVRDGQEAVDRLLAVDLASDEAPTVVFLDIKLPRVHGLEVLRRLRTDPKTRTIPVTILTSSDEPQDISACYQAGASSYLCKPVDFDAYMSLVGNAARYWLVSNVATPTE